MKSITKIIKLSNDSFSLETTLTDEHVKGTVSPMIYISSAVQHCDEMISVDISEIDSLIDMLTEIKQTINKQDW